MYIMKRLMMLIIILTISSTVFSQSVTDTSHNTKKDTTHYKFFPIPIVKKITQDLLRFDSCKENLEKTNEELIQVYNELSLKDSIINKMKIKEVNYDSIINQEKIENNLSENRVKNLEFNLGVQQTKNKLTSIFSGGIIIILTLILIIRH